MTYTEEQLREVAGACFRNARDLYEDACLLQSHARYPRALVLAVIGAEEFAKAMEYTIAALNPSERERLPTVLRELRTHLCKHHADATIEGVFIAAQEGVDTEAAVAGVPVAPDSYVRAALGALARWRLQELLGSNPQAKKKEEQPATQHAQALNDISPDSAPSTAKERGLYVELLETGLATPSQLQEQDALPPILGLEWSLDAFHDLPHLLEDDHQWTAFAQTIRQRLAPRPS